VVLTIADIAEVVVHYFLHLVQEISVPFFLVFFKKKRVLNTSLLKLKLHDYIHEYIMNIRAREHIYTHTRARARTRQKYKN